MSEITAQTAKVSKVRFAGASIDGSYPIVRLDDTTVVIRHPTHGNIRVQRVNTDLPASAPVTLAYEDLLADIRSRFDTLARVIDGIVKGHHRSVITSGAPGVGKTHAIESILSAAKKDGKIKEFTVVRGTISPLGLYVLMWENRQPGQVIVLDDSDDIYDDNTGVDIIKAATDTGKKRRVSYLKELAMFDIKGIANNFIYEGSIIVATNIDFEREIASKSKRAVHLEAVINRAMYINLGLHSKQALMARVEDVIRTTPMLKDVGLDEVQSETVLNWLKDNQSTVRSLSLRTAMAIGALILSEPETWKLTAKTTLLKTVSR